MSLVRLIVTALIAHFLAAIFIAICTVEDWRLIIVSAGFYSVFGVFYLVLEIPLMFLVQLLIKQQKNKFRKLLVGVACCLLGALFGYFLCFSEGGSKPFDYAVGYSVAGALVALVAVSFVNFVHSK